MKKMDIKYAFSVVSQNGRLSDYDDYLDGRCDCFVVTSHYPVLPSHTLGMTINTIK